jgi:predicted DNA-binding transcriptional regulator YafY
VHPLGLAAKGAVWYLVGDTEAGLRTFRVDRMTSVEPNGQPVTRPDGFDLHQAWKLITEEVETKRTPVIATARVTPDSVPTLRWILGTRVRIGPAGDDGRIEVELRGHNVHSLAGEIAGLGSAVEVLDPLDLRQHLRAIGTELARTYG